MFGNHFIEDYVKAGHNGTPAKELEALSTHTNSKIRLRVAENESTPSDVLERLVKDPDSDVRLAAATNPSTPVDLVFSLALDEDPSVRHGLAEDPNTPLGLLKILAQDENAYVSCRAQKTLLSMQKQWKKNSEISNVIAWPIMNVGVYA
jgi:HEAT repeat protein